MRDVTVTVLLPGKGGVRGAKRGSWHDRYNPTEPPFAFKTVAAWTRGERRVIKSDKCLKERDRGAQLAPFPFDLV